jgi:hypothetical protein
MMLMTDKTKAEAPAAATRRYTHSLKHPMLEAAEQVGEMIEAAGDPDRRKKKTKRRLNDDGRLLNLGFMLKHRHALPQGSLPT